MSSLFPGWKAVHQIMQTPHDSHICTKSILRLTSLKRPVKIKFQPLTLKYKVLCYLCITKCFYQKTIIMQNETFMTTKSKRLIAIVLAVPALLLIPFIAMQFTDEVNWSPFDFVVMGCLLLGTGLLCELAIRKIKTIRYRIIIVAVILIALFLIWAELAVGIFGTPFAGS